MSVKGDLSSSEKELLDVIATGKPLPARLIPARAGRNLLGDPPHFRVTVKQSLYTRLKLLCYTCALALRDCEKLLISPSAWLTDSALKI